MADNLSDDAIKQAILAARGPSNLVTEADVEQPSIAQALYDIGAAIPSAVSRYVSSVPERFSAATERVSQMSPTEIAQSLGSTAKAMIVDPAVQAFTAPGRAYRGEIPQEQMLPEALNFTGMTTLGGIPASALERSGGMMLGTSGTRMLPETAAVELAKRELSPVGLYSHGAEAAMAIPQAKGAAEQMVGMLRKQPGVSESELINAGILTPEGQLNPDFASRGTITREDLSSYLQSRMPQVEEIVLSTDQKPVYYISRDGMRHGPYYHQNDAEFVKKNRGWDDANIEQDFKYDDKTKYSQYTLPGGENYREVLLKLPQVKNKPIEIGKLPATELFERNMMEKYGGNDFRSIYQKLNGNEIDKYNMLIRDEINTSKNESLLQDKRNNFQSQHWNDPNVLAHIRMADRTGPNGEKILHVEEVQSDWGQKGKKTGFQDQRDALLQDVINKEKASSVAHQLNMSDEEKAARLAAYNDANAKLMEFEKHGKPVPNAPYVTSTQGWTDLALKRILKEAAEGGYDKVVWTPGVEQAGRYDLSKHIDRLNYEPWQQDGENLYAIEAFDPKGKKVYDHDALNEKELENYFGKEIAEKIITDQGQYMKERPLRDWRSFSGVDLQTGGEGMKEYYDKILPNRLQSVAKKHDKNAKVQYTDVMLPPSGERGTNNPPIQAPGLDITPQMRESILKGQGAFMDGGRVGYAGKGKVKEDDTVRSALDIARQYEDPANRIEADIRALTQNLSGLDIASAFPAFHTGLPQRPQVGGAGLVPPRPSNESVAKTIALEELARAAGITPREYGERFTSLKKPATPFEEWQYTQQQNAALKPRKVFDPNEMKVGDVIIPFVGDLTSAGQKVTNINQRQLAKPLLTEGGESYMRSTPDIWASGQSIISALNNRAQRAIEIAKAMGNKEPTAYGFHVGMDPMAGDFSTHTAEGILGLLPTAKIKASDAKKFDQFMKTPTSEFKGFKDWPGLKSEKLHDYLMEQGKGAARIKFSKGMDKAEWRDLGFPDVGPARFASTEILLGGLPTGATGTSIGRLATENAVSKAPESIHRSYPVSLRGEYVGGLSVPLQRDLIFKDWSDRFDANPPERNFISAKNKSYANKDAYQIVTNRWLDTISKALEDAKRNRAEGGRTMGNNALGNALRMARDHFDFGGDVRGGDSPFMSRADYGLREAPTPSFREAEDRSMREYNRAIESGWSPTGGGSDRSQSPLENTLTGRSQGFEGAPAVNMPSNIGELLGYNRARQSMLQQQRQQQSAEQEAENQRIKDALAMASVGQTSFDQTGILPSGFPPVAKQPVYWGGTPADLPASIVERALQLTQMPSIMGLPAGTTLGRTEMPLQAEMAGSPQETYDQMFARSTFAPQVNAQFAMAGSPYAVTPSAPTTMIAGLNRPAFPHSPTPPQATQASIQPDVSAPFVQPNRPITLTPQTAQQQVAQNVPLPPNVVRDAIVAASSPPVVVASAPQPVIDAAASDQDALVLSGRKTFELPKNAPMPVPRPSDVRESNPIAAVIDSIKSDLARQEGERINALEAAGKTATYPGYSTASDPLAAQRAYLTDIGLDPNNPADMAKVKARIIQQDGQDKVDYYTKSLSEALFGAPSEEQKVAAALTAAREGGGGDRAPVQQAATQAPTVTPPPYTTELSEGNLALPHPEGLSAQQWADKYAGGDINKVHARVKFMNGAPTLEYYTV